MGAVTYLLLLLLIALSYEINPNEENELGAGQPTSESPYMEQNNQDEDHNHDVIERPGIGGTIPQEKAPYFINLKKMPKIHVIPAGNMISLECKAGGYPTPNVTWYKKDKPPTRRFGSVPHGQWSLTFEDLVTDDSGTYKCVVCNALGCINYKYTVDVIERYHNRPILTEPPQNKTVVVGSNVNISCTFVSDLKPHVYWVNGIPGENGTIKTSATSQNPEILELHNVTYESEGWYTCVAANSLGMTTASAYLKVVDTLEEEFDSNLGGVRPNRS